MSKSNTPLQIVNDDAHAPMVRGTLIFWQTYELPDGNVYTLPPENRFVMKRLWPTNRTGKYNGLPAYTG